MKRHRKRKQVSPSVDGDAIEGFLKQLDRVFQSNQDNPNPPYPYDRKTNAIRLPGSVELELRHLLAQGRKVEAVKRTTRLTGAGLRVSKDYVDNLARTVSFGDRPLS